MAASAAIFRFWRGDGPCQVPVPIFTRAMSWTSLLAALTPLSWLLPQHYLPWLTAHQEALAWALTALAGLFVARRPTTAVLPMPWLIAIVVALLSIAWQLGTGRLAFRGDALLTVTILVTLMLAFMVGIAMTKATAESCDNAIATLFAGTLVAALLSVAVGLMQWTDTRALPLPVAAFMPGDRPYANFAQANHFSTACFLGLCALCGLRESRLCGRWGSYIGGIFLLLGMVLSGSRTGWLQVVAAVVLVAVTARRAGGRVNMAEALCALAAMAVLTLAWPGLNDFAGLNASRTFAQAAQPDMRVDLWRHMAGAVWQGPWDGWGWRQISAAQLATALSYPSLHRYFDHAHNLVLDLVLWAGLVPGLLITGCMGWGLWAAARQMSDPRARWLLLGALGLVLHALVEYPLDYVYFLLPFGIALGAVHGMGPVGHGVTVPTWLVRSTAAASLAVLVAVTIDYVAVEDDYRIVRLESTFGERRITSPLPDLRVLDHMYAYLGFIRTPARAGMSPEELARFEAVANRFAHPPVLLRLALAQGLNGRPQAAAETMQRLCAIHLPVRCAEGRESWILLQSNYPALSAVPPPLLPDSRAQ